MNISHPRHCERSEAIQVNQVEGLASGLCSSVSGLPRPPFGPPRNDVKIAFSLVELLITLIVVSVLLAALVPVISKKLKNSSISLSQMSEITTECENSNCELCTKKYCIKCGLDSCTTGQYANTKKCECSSCTDWDSNCVECDSKACTKCRDGYYIKDNKCAACPTGGCCDGVRVYTTVPSGYYCDGNILYKCVNSFSSKCTACNTGGCTACQSGYYLKNGDCSSCNVGNCVSCTSEGNCTACANKTYFVNSKTCSMCYNAIAECDSCSSATNCTSCYGGYYVNTQGGCTSCSISNCQKCVNKRSATSPMCEVCSAGYYLLGGACLACSKYDSNCVVCDSTKCLSCKSGYHLENSKCVSNDNKFGCSDANFMQIGSLCVTRKNMGDSLSLPIPASVTVVNTGEYCYAHSKNQKCCWKETAATNCDASNGSYSGCSRTVCSWDAAQEICAKFNYGGRIWRLPAKEEIQNWYQASHNIASNGLMLCDQMAGYGSAYCRSSSNCLGAYDSACYQYNIISQSATSSSNYYQRLYGGEWLGPFSQPKAVTGSIRCVSEM